MANEDIQFRVGLDAAPFEKGLNDTRSIAARMTEKFSESFDKVKETVHGIHKAWHETLHSITEESPLLGNALRIAFSPITGTLLAAVGVFKVVHGHLEEMGKRFDTMGDAAAKSIGNIQEAMKEARKNFREQQDKWDEWVESHKHAGEDISKQLETQLGLLKQQQTILDNILQREKQRLISGVRARVASGEITKEEGEAQEAVINRGYEYSKRFSGYGEVQNELRMRKAAAAELLRRKNIAAGQTRAAQFEQGRLIMPLTPEAIKKQIEDLEKLQAVYEEDLKDLQQKFKEDEEFSHGKTFMGAVVNSVLGLFGYEVADPNNSQAWRGEFDRAKKMIKGVTDDIKRIKTRQEREMSQAAAAAKKVTHGQTAQDELQRQIQANADAISSLQLQGPELLSAMDPKERQAAMEKGAWDNFVQSRAEIMRRFGMFYDRRSGRVANRFGVGPEMLGDTGRDFNSAMRAATQEYQTNLRNAAKAPPEMISAARSLEEINSLLKSTVTQP